MEPLIQPVLTDLNHEWKSSPLFQEEVLKITNNAPERYNRGFDDLFSKTHLNICSSTEIIKNEFRYYEKRVHKIRKFPSGIMYRNPILSKNSIL